MSLPVRQFDRSMTTLDIYYGMTFNNVVKTDDGKYQTTKENVFTAGDMHRGQSLVVWAIREGREAAKTVDESLMGYTNL